MQVKVGRMLSTAPLAEHLIAKHQKTTVTPSEYSIFNKRSDILLIENKQRSFWQP